mmetsp:Transcript_12369/g.43568  ORF Transcript_12369/g.43568 Transcript_12369/m.43568 type:complete len:208 (+) Transcript_12369:67-690(+)
MGRPASALQGGSTQIEVRDLGERAERVHLDVLRGVGDPIFLLEDLEEDGAHGERQLLGRTDAVVLASGHLGVDRHIRKVQGVPLVLRLGSEHKLARVDAPPMLVPARPADIQHHTSAALPLVHRRKACQRVHGQPGASFALPVGQFECDGVAGGDAVARGSGGPIREAIDRREVAKALPEKLCLLARRNGEVLCRVGLVFRVQHTQA